jgi:ribosome recycling factor
MVESAKKDARERMEKAVETVRNEFAKLRSGKATPAILDGLKIDYYGTPTPIKQIANVSAPEPRLLVVQPWERNMLGEIERTIIKSDLGLNPANDGIVIRIPIPQLSEERRRDLVKVAKKDAEEGRIAIRNIRRDANEHIKKAEKAGEISEDDSHHAQDDVQKLTDEFIKKIDEHLELKEKEILGQ